MYVTLHINSELAFIQVHRLTFIFWNWEKSMRSYHEKLLENKRSLQAFEMSNNNDKKNNNDHVVKLVNVLRPLRL